MSLLLALQILVSIINYIIGCHSRAVSASGDIAASSKSKLNTMQYKISRLALANNVRGISMTLHLKEG